MLELPIEVKLTIVNSGARVAARLIELDTRTAKKLIDPRWWTGLGVSNSQREKEIDHQWNWADLIGKHRNNLYYEAVGVQSEDSDVQAAMLYRLDGLSVLGENVSTVYIDRLAAAPRNREWLVANPLYRNGGTTLIRWAAYHSVQLGFSGRLTLACVPSRQAQEFYGGLNFIATSEVEDDMVIYELTPDAAAMLIAQDPQLV